MQKNRIAMTTESVLRILVLEDVAVDAERMIEELHQADIACVARRVDTEDAFLEALDRDRPDIILADFSLPNFTAIDALHLLKKRLPFDIPFILVTGTQSETAAILCMKAGADDYILKQSLTRLPAAVLNALEKKRMKADRERTEEALREQEEQYRLIMEHTHDLISMLDLKGRILYISPSARDRLGYAPDDLIGRSFSSLIHPADRRIFRTVFRKAVSSKKGRLTGSRYKHRSGEWRFFESVLSWIADPEGHPQKAVVVARDISERKLAEEQMRASRNQLRALAAHLQTVREQERAHIAREIHDELGQHLTGLKMDVSWVQNKLTQLEGKESGVSVILHRIGMMSRLIDETIQMVRKISTELRPGVLDDLGLVSAIEWQAQEFQERTGIRCTFTSTLMDDEVPEICSTAVFRICQEALTNIARHARASQVAITLKRNIDSLVLDIEDNGQGISQQALTKTKSLGLVGMQERATLVGGALNIKGIPGKGTIVTVRIPLDQHVNGAAPD
jgi:two-component system sensor histidine kinase UhpB